MIGRGTRLLEPKKMKQWCLEKDKFLIMDCWENFEYFQMNPQGKTERDSKPIPVRLFQAKLQKLNAVDSAEKQDLRNKVIESLKQDIAKLPEKDDQIKAMKIVKKHKLSARDTEHMVRNKLGNTQKYREEVEEMSASMQGAIRGMEEKELFLQYKSFIDSIKKNPLSRYKDKSKIFFENLYDIIIKELTLQLRENKHEIKEIEL